jgi:CheY-like chemotaxis protein
MPKRVLIIHDEVKPRNGIRTVLTDVGFEATLAGDHMVAQKALQGELFDLIVVKTDFPEFDGRRMTFALRRSGSTNADTPVLGVTTDGSQAHARDCWHSGINTLVLSPGNKPDLLAAVRPLGFEFLAPPRPQPTPVQTAADTATSLATLKALGSDLRLKLFMAIAEAGGLTASEAGDKMDISRALARHHLKDLRELQLVTSRVRGKEVVFTVQPDGLAAVAQWLLNLAAQPSG